MKLVIVGMFCFVLLSLNSVSAWGPNTHLNITLASLDGENETLIAQIINDNFDACLVGLAYPDVGIFEYFTNFKAYQGLHDYNTFDELMRIARNDRDRAFNYCYKIHLSEDGISHNFFVPAAIKRTKLPNYILHAIQELKIESRYLDPRAQRLMEKHAEFDGQVAKATGRDWSSEAAKLNTILGGSDFYDKAYSPDTTTWFGRVQNWMYTVVGKVVSEETGVDYYNLAIAESMSVLRGETPSIDPSGEEALNKADAETKLWLYVLTFLAVFVVYFLSFRWNIIGFTKNRFKIR